MADSIVCGASIGATPTIFEVEVLASIPAALLMNATPFEAEVLARVTETIGQPLPARERALVDQHLAAYRAQHAA